MTIIHSTNEKQLPPMNVYIVERRRGRNTACNVLFYLKQSQRLEERRQYQIIGFSRAVTHSYRCTSSRGGSSV